MIPKVSIIIPVYNMEKYLRQCLDSVVNQTLQDIEIICIDDCSTDNSLQILKEYASKDNRIRIIEQKINQGQGVARNEAIKIATGEYIGFVDPDDWIEPNMYEEMYNKAKEFNTDIVICNLELFFSDSNYKKTINTLENFQKFKTSIKTNSIYNFNNLENLFLENSYNFSCARLYNANFIKNNNIHFSKTKRSEDVIFCDFANFKAKRIFHIDKNFYHYRKHRKNEYIKNIDLIKLCLEYINVFYPYINSTKLLNGIQSKIVHLCLLEYKNLNNKNEQNFLYNECRKFLPNTIFLLLKKEIIKYSIKQIFRLIFSTKNIIENGAIYKYLYILGFKIKLGKKEYND